MNESRIENDFEHYYNAVQKLKEDVAELTKKLDDREADLLNVRAETLKEVGEYIDQQHDILAEDLGYILAFLDGLAEASKRGGIPKE